MRSWEIILFGRQEAAGGGAQGVGGVGALGGLGAGGPEAGRGVPPGGRGRRQHDQGIHALAEDLVELPRGRASLTASRAAPPGSKLMRSTCTVCTARRAAGSGLDDQVAAVVQGLEQHRLIIAGLDRLQPGLQTLQAGPPRGVNWPALPPLPARGRLSEAELQAMEAIMSQDQPVAPVPR